ncbi:MAG: hypothetical protein HKN73_07120, partial [Gemmatimonadetes bacterium]|nr:hypothetical protein [Gemmatimonadota bacterium]
MRGPLAVTTVAVLVTLACSERSPDPWSRVDAFGAPRQGLSEGEVERFEEGRALFNRIFTAEEGLGPLFNEDQCSACHTDPAPGGTGEQVVRKAARFEVETGSCDLLVEAGGENLRSRVAQAAAEMGVVRDTVPSAATHVGSFDVPLLFGLGAADALPDSTLERMADPDDLDGDGISGRLGRTADGRIGRFGRKADVATLRDFTVSALLNEMGVTADGRSERGTNGGALPV